MKKRICHITTLHPANDVRIFKKQCVDLHRTGDYEVYFVAVNATTGLVDGVKVISKDVADVGRLKRFYQTGKVAFQLAKDVDAEIYHFHDPNFLPWAKKLKRLGKKVVYDIHEDLPRQVLGKRWIPAFLRKLIATLLENYENKIAGKMDGLVAATPIIKERFIKLNSNTIDVCNFPILNEEKVGADQSASNICYVGGLGRNRGVYEMVAAMEHFDGVLHLAGKFENKQTEDEITAMPGWKKVKYYGYIDKKEVEEIFSKCSVGIVTLYPLLNYLEALPVKLFEYMNYGLAVISSDFPYWKNIVDNANAGVCIPAQNAGELTKALNHLKANPEERKQYGLNGKKAVLSKYNWASEFKKLKAFIAHYDSEYRHSNSL